MADTHIFLRLPNVSGESTAAGHVEDIELESVTWSIARKEGSKAEAPDGKKQVQLGTVTITKHFDLSSPRIMKRIREQRRSQQRYAFQRMSIVYADIVPNKSGGNHIIPVIEYLLQDCYVESMSVGAGGSKAIQVTEDLTVKFMKVEVTYHPPSADRGSRSRGIVFKSTASAGKS